MQHITPFLWFDQNAEDALNFYTSTFPDSKVVNSSRYPAGSPGPEGSLMTATIELHGQRFMLLNGGPGHPFTDAISFVIHCKDQDEIDRYWTNLTSGGGREIQCGWLQDRFGLAWQVVPTALGELMTNPDPKKRQRVMKALLKMVKLDIATLKSAAEG